MGIEHEAAYSEALQRIRLAHQSGTGELELCLADLALTCLPEELGELTGLTRLRVDGCVELRDLSSLRLCTRLMMLDLRACPKVIDLNPLRGLHALRKLYLGVRDWEAAYESKELRSKLGNIDVLTDLKALETLTLGGCWRISNFQPLTALTALQHLNLIECKQLQNLQPLAGLTALQHLDLGLCEQLQDLQPLANLTALQYLDLRGCGQLQDLQPMAKLIALQYLDLRWCKQLQSLQSLARLTALQYLDLNYCEQLQDLQPLAKLTALQYLALNGCKQLQDFDFQPLANLTALQHLDLGYCEQLQDLQPLAKLTALQYLDLSGCRQLKDLQPLAGLTALQHLDLGLCVQLQSLQPLANLTALQHLDLRGCGQLQSLQPLANLTALQHLDLGLCEQLQDLQPLANLTALQHLDLGLCVQLKDLRPLAKLTALQYLDLDYCDQLKGIKPLAKLTALQYLDLSGCGQLQDLQPLTTLVRLKEFRYLDAGLLDCTPAVQPLASWGQLEELYVNQLIAAPSELKSRDEDDNALPRLHGWQQDLAAGEAPNSTVKLYVLGNSRVGKTQICRRLCGEPFEPSIPSTHGIRLGQLQLMESRRDQPAVEAHFWDFGGQDVYLGTHALFLDERAIYVIAWNPQYEYQEKRQVSEPQGVPWHNRSLVYWLEYVRSLAGPQAPVIVVQTQCDWELDARAAPMPAEHGFERLRVTSSSAKLDDGMERLQLELKSAARYQLERYGKVRLPASWVAVDEELRTRIGQKTLPRDAFDELCRTQHGTAVPDVVLEYFHRSGLVFWRAGLFGNQVILDLAWALEGIYAVLEPHIVLPEIRRQGGHFSPQLLGVLAWRDYGEAERTLFLTLMEQCQICFKIAADIYIAPVLLPALDKVEPAMQQVWRETKPEAVVRLDYPFLHEGVLRAMLCGIGQEAGVYAVYWAYGICFYDAEQQSTVRIQSQLPDVAAGQPGGSITIEAAGPGATPLASYLTESIQQLNIGRPPQVTWEAGQPSDATWKEADTADLREPAFTAVAPARPPRLAGEAQPVYVSYKCGESEALVDELERRLPESFKLIRDKNVLRPGDWISRFMAEIGRADLVVVVLSDKYVRSVYCMRELLYLFQTSQGERDTLMQRIVPLLVGELKCARVSERDVYVSYWEQESANVEALLKTRGLGSVGVADRAEWLAIQDFKHHVSDILAWVADTLMPQSAELHPQRIDAAIQLLQQRTSALRI